VEAERHEKQRVPPLEDHAPKPLHLLQHGVLAPGVHGPGFIA
jgi:hypothetical protein